MNVRGSPANGVKKHLVHVLYDGGIVDIARRDNGIVFLVTAFGFNAFKVGVIQITHRRIVGLKILVDGFPELGVVNQDGVCAQAGIKLDLIQCLNVGRVGDRNEQPVPTLIERQGVVFSYQFFIYDLIGHHLRHKGVEIQNRNAELHRSGEGEPSAVRQVVLYQVGNEWDAVVGCLKKGIFRSGFINKPVVDETSRQACKRYIAFIGRHKLCKKRSLSV